MLEGRIIGLGQWFNTTSPRAHTGLSVSVERKPRNPQRRLASSPAERQASHFQPGSPRKWNQKAMVSFFVRLR
ncbi:MAG: hypothetical protein MUF01_06435 [Bryobacterales bacterium]|nr:hypothetical protein [Bryobacterales bacterium]